MTAERFTFADLAAEILRRPPHLGAVRLVAVDGPGGAGKSTFAARLAAAIQGSALLHTDDFASWAEPLAWWPDLEVRVLEPLARAESASYPAFDWRPRRLREWVTVQPVDVVILEGVSSGRLAAADRLTFTVWVDAPPAARLRRGLERDGEGALPDWERWTDEETAHFAADGTRHRANLVVDGAPSIACDAATEFVRLT